VGEEIFKIPGAKSPRIIGLQVAIREVTITLEDKVSGGVSCSSNPSFATLAGVAANGKPMNQVHKFALVALGRVMSMAKPK
jgi:hypothetical protein